MGKTWEGIQSTIRSLKKYKYVIIILLIGLGLLLIPGEKNNQSLSVPVEKEIPFSPEAYAAEMEQRLSQILSQIQGVGETEVILTLKQGEQTHYLYDTDVRKESGEKNSSSEEIQKTVIISSGNAYDEAMVTRKDYPLFQGALIVCRGGGEAEVKLKLTQAVSALTNLSSDKITILKMK